MHSHRVFIGYENDAWTAVRAHLDGVGQAQGALAHAQPCDCVPQHTRRSSEMDPDDVRRPRRYLD